MESLYVCLFSNGHVKVGRSGDAEGRIRQHEKRVSCLGISLTKNFTVECVGSALQAEVALIARCAAEAEERHKHEWFTGLAYEEVCRWATECAETAPPAHDDTYIDAEMPDWRNVLRVLKLAGYTQMELAGLCRCSQASISELACGITKDPAFSIGAKLLQLAQAVQRSVGDVNPVVSSSLAQRELPPASTSGAFFSQGA